MTKRGGIYLRVSTDEQTTENQRRELLEAAGRAGWKVLDIYEDAGVSGAKGRDQRPEFDRLLKNVARRRIDVVAAWSVDRLSRSTIDLLGFLRELHAVGCDLFLLKQGFDSGTPHGRLMFGMLGLFAEFERDMICERVKAGMARAKAEGKPIGRPRLVDDKTQLLLEALNQGDSIRVAAKKAGVGRGTAERMQRQLTDQHGGGAARRLGEGDEQVHQ